MDFGGMTMFSMMESVVCPCRFWWSLMVGVDWWDAVGCTQSAAECGIGKH